MQKLTCKKCGHKWTPRGDSKPLSCPACKQYKWEQKTEPKTEKETK